jgi:hypothetical protein
VDQHFRDGFEKEAGLKHLALAGSLALSPVAKAGGDAAKTTFQALKKTQVGQQVSGKIKDYGRKVKDYVKVQAGADDAIHIQANAGKNSGSASSPGATPKISLKDLGGVHMKYKDFQASASPSSVKARYNITDNAFVEGFRKGNNSGVQVGYNKAF